jgi:subtilisin-like proprotein convertase family protein
MKKKLILLFVFITCITQAQSDKIWSEYNGNSIVLSKSVKRASFPLDFKMYQLNSDMLKQKLVTAANRFDSKAKGVVITMPNLNGKMEAYEVFEASNFEPALQAQYPDIRSYIGQSLTDSYAQLRLSISPQGIQTMVFRTDKKTEFMEPYSEDNKVYALYSASRQKGKLPFVCSTEDKIVAKSLSNKISQNRSSASQLLTLRLALSCTGEYGTYFGGVSGALAQMNATMTRVNGVFERDLTIHMNIIANNTSIIYTNATTDPYSNSTPGVSEAVWSTELQNNLTSVIGDSGYDIGHLFGASGGGGNAGCIGCVCVDGQKGRGFTSPGSGPAMGDDFDIDFVAHEMGHQFGGNHTFSFDNEGTGVNVEPGSGSTIMAYAGITDQDVQAHSDDYFHYVTINQIELNMINKTCPVRTTITNIAPSVNAGLDYVIPKSTPFVLTGTGLDPDGNALTYCWEQMDSALGSQKGASSAASATKVGGPNWRSYSPTASPSRYFPPLENVIANTSTTSGLEITTEALSSVGRTLNFAFTGRDNVINGGLTKTDAMLVTVDGTAGPFLVTQPNSNVSWVAGTNQTVTWDVAGTNANGINATSIDIFLSIDGGNTYPILLASKVPNDGSETIIIPNNVGATNRIMVKGNNHIFYDISNANFTIAAPTSSFLITFAGTQQEQTKTICLSPTSSVSFNLSYEVLNGFSGNTTFTATGNPVGSNITFSPALIASNGTVIVTIDNLISQVPGLYTIIVNATSGGITKTAQCYIQLGVSDTSLISPKDLAINQNTTLNFSWLPSENATSYEIQIATDSNFTNVIKVDNATSSSYSISELAPDTDYFWRVMPKNAICNGLFSNKYTFKTGIPACSKISSTNIPIAISVTGASTITSSINIASGNILSDLNITMDLSHTWINDLTATLLSPSGTEIQLYTNPCNDNIPNITATFDDSGIDLLCGSDPGISGTVKPVQKLSGFNGENSTGRWTLKITDCCNGDGGSLNSWSLNICTLDKVATNNSNNYLLFPNPNKGSFTIKADSLSKNRIDIKIYDLSGRLVFEKSYSNTEILNQNIDLNTAQAGFYLMTIDDGENKIGKNILIK